ncbi:uncharacterized protein [Aegilops tauschii subsp. strangulata]|uniref:uncharacterized protein n=1 Tax=Aegilops tauschii subsp. strangulata TaxID=200361 RepID=UPI00098A2047|nr:uncharacterized protein LOC109766653 [Aegilops tauschii subsp. strangulata]
MDGLVDACKVPYVYKSFGCERYVDQHSLAEHSSRCAHAPCYYYECTPPFEGSPASLVHHLTTPSVNHYWPPAVNIKYETCYPFAVPESLEDHRRLLVTEEDGIVFLLAVGTGKACAGRRPVSVVCIRGNTADADTRPVYGCVLTVTASPKYEGTHATSITLTGTVPSCSILGNVDMEDAWYDFHPKMLHEDSKEVHLVIGITKSTVHH